MPSVAEDLTSQSPLQLVLSRLEAVKQCRKGFMALCPGHGDKNASLSIASGRDGRVLLHCHAGCATKTVVRALGLTMRDLFPNDRLPSFQGNRPGQRGRKLVAAYGYYDRDGNLRYEIVRYQPKSFAVRRPDGKGGWIWGLGNTAPLLYHLRELLGAGSVIVVEGEADVEALRSLGIVATSSPFGAGKFRREFGPDFKGKLVAILPDNDRAGQEHARQVASVVFPFARSVRIVQLPGLPEGGDVSDWLADRNHVAAKEELQGLINRTPLLTKDDLDGCLYRRTAIGAPIAPADGNVAPSSSLATFPTRRQVADSRAAASDRVQASIAAALRKRPGLTEPQLCEALHLDKVAVGRELRRMLEGELVIRNGKGRKGSPYNYYLSFSLTYTLTYEGRKGEAGNGGQVSDKRGKILPSRLSRLENRLKGEKRCGPCTNQDGVQRDEPALSDLKGGRERVTEKDASASGEYAPAGCAGELLPCVKVKGSPLVGDYWLVPDAISARELDADGLPVFFFDEVDLLRGKSADELRAIADIKRVFPGSRIVG